MPRQPILAVLCGSLLAWGAQAASVQESTDLLQRPLGAATAAGGKTLERALEVDTNTGQRNLDLLLEARGAGEAVGGQPPPGEPPARRQALTVQPPQSSTAASAQPVALPPPPLGLQTDDGSQTGAATARREWLGTGPSAQLGTSTGQGAAIGVGIDSPDPRDARGSPGARGEIDPALRLLWLSDTVQFLREHRHWLLAGLALLAAVVAGLQAYARRPR